jgi:hypothetical protein
LCTHSSSVIRKSMRMFGKNRRRGLRINIL